ncbi:MAG: AAA family ATPase [Acidobacteriota bacterium]|nr:AAA family ATPase [Acidobacteriota bacterium]
MEQSTVVIPGYQIIECLNQGSHTVVYRGVRQGDDLPVILKVLDTSYPSLKHLARLKHEYGIISGFESEDLVQSIDFRGTGNQVILVLEDDGGMALHQYLQSHEVSLGERLDLCLAIARQLKLIHDKQVIHKDINPGNIIINPETGLVRIIDFSIAAHFSEAGQKKTGLHTLAGTLAYISPEQTGRMSRGVDYRSDFYSLGITMYEIFTGRLPFEVSDAMELVHCHLARSPLQANQVDAKTPVVLSEILARLMAKNPEDRYQSTDGIIADILKCRELLSAKGRIPRFPIGEKDIHHVFRVPQFLYGREQEIKTLTDAFYRVCDGSRELLLISGQSGVGKSALIQEIYQPVTRRRGHLIVGKFDQFQHNIPYAALIQAFSEMVHQILALSSSRLAAWRSRIIEALGPNCAVLLEVVPELALIVGEQPEVEELSTAETENRFHQVIKEFIGVLATPEHPLVIFLDDLQWADSATLRMVEILVEDRTLKGLLLIGAYRESDIGNTHALHHTLLRLRGIEARVQHIFLNRLRSEHVTQIVADTLRTGTEEVTALARLVYRKTEGNPFFVNEFLKALHKEKLIFFNEEKDIWTWDEAGVSRKGVTENVLEFLTTRLQKLPEETREALILAACVGNPFKISDLAMIEGRTAGNVAKDLDWAVREGLVFPRDEEFVPADTVHDQSGVPRTYEFLHDRVQQAAIQLIKPEARQQLHLKIGRLMLENASEEELGEHLFDIANQFNMGQSWLDDPEERLRVARLNLLAGIRARLSTAYEPALGFLTYGLGLLPANCWETCHGLSMALYRERAECEYLCGHFEVAEHLFGTALENGRTVMEKAAIYNLRTELYVHLGKYLEAIEVGLKGLHLFGIYISVLDDELHDESLAMLASIQESLGDLEIEDLMALPHLDDEVIHAVMKLMVNMWTPAANVNLNLMKLLSLYIVRLSLEHGNAELSSFGYTAYGMVLGSEYGDYDNAWRFGQLGLEMSRKFENVRLHCRVAFFHGAFIIPWCRPLGESLDLLKEAYRAGLECGDFMWAATSLFHLIYHRQQMGDPLQTIFKETENYLGFMSKVRYEPILELVELLRRGIRRLQGSLTDAIASFEDSTFGDEFLKRNQKRLFLVSVFHYHLWQGRHAFQFGDYEEAIHQLNTAEKYLPFAFGWTSITDFYFYKALTCSALIYDAKDDEREGLLRTVSVCREHLEEWAEANPDNFEHKFLMVTGELAGLLGRFEQAINCYDTALDRAREWEMVDMVALAAELAGHYLIQNGKPRLAMVYLGDACMFYEQYGARALVERLRSMFPRLARQQYQPFMSSHQSASTTSEDGSGFLDMSSLMKASLAISNEIHMERLLEKLIRIVIENAGAQRGLLLLEKEGKLYVEAEGHVDEEQVTLPQSIPLDQLSKVSRSLVHYVFNTSKPVVLDNASRSGEFTSDPYIAGNKIKSILCQPVLFKGNVSGILYLENNLVSSAFTTYHLEVLKLLTSEAAIAIDNARLYANLARASERLRESYAELERYNRDLERMVDDRTREIKLKNRELEQTLARNREMQKQIIQQEKLASLGTLTAGIAHEIRNPLNFVNNFAEVSVEILADLDDDLQTNPAGPITGEQRLFLDETLDDLRKNLVKINDHGRRADRIVHNMLMHSHNKSSEKPEAVDINIMVDEYVKLSYHSTRARDSRFSLKLQTDYAQDLDLLEIIPQDLSRVFLNIVDNACYAMRERQAGEGESYQPALFVSTIDVGAFVEILIRDNGGGIPHSVIEKVFTPFYTTKPAGKGTGLGLSICYDIVVKQHHGELEVTSENGETEFRIRLPKKRYKPPEDNPGDA